MRKRYGLRIGVLAVVLAAVGLEIGAAGNANAESAGSAAAPPPICVYSVGTPFVSGGFRPTATVRASISCSFTGDLQMELTLVTARGETTRQFEVRGSSLSGTTSRRCVEGVYYGKAVVSVEGPNYAHQGTYLSDPVYLTCE